jgi:hypothetical protein
LQNWRYLRDTPVPPMKALIVVGEPWTRIGETSDPRPEALIEGVSDVYPPALASTELHEECAS